MTEKIGDLRKQPGGRWAVVGRGVIRSRSMRTIMVGLAEFEHDLVKERVKSGHWPPCWLPRCPAEGPGAIASTGD